MAAISKQLNLRIIGMHCAGCVSAVEQALRSAEGVSDAQVQLLTESAQIRLSHDVPATRLIAAVRSAGYDAQSVQSDDAAQRLASERDLKEALRQHRQAIIQALMYALPIIALEHARHHLWPATTSSQIAARLMQLVLLIMMMSSVAAPILAGGLRALLSGAANMDSLISLGVLAALISSLYGTLIARDDSFIHFHAAAMILALVIIGRYLEARARTKANAAMTALAKRAAKTVMVQRGDAFMESAIEDIKVGDIIRVDSGGSVPADGLIIDGHGSVDESLMTGESMPRVVHAGDSILGGSVLVEGSLKIQATAIADRSTLGRILQLVRRAQSGQTQMQRQADRLAAIFTPIIIAIAILTFAGWLVIVGRHALGDATRATVAVLVVACPCALGLATPAVVAVASGLAALRGILVRDAAMLEAMGHIDTVVWDKTGTITTGQPSVQKVEPLATMSPDKILRLAASAEQFSSHPIARAITAEARRRSIAILIPENPETIPGGGVIAKVNDHHVIVGSSRFLEEKISSFGPIAPIPQAAATQVLIAIDGAVSGWITLTDTLRPSSRDAVQRLAKMGITSELLTGDHSAAANSIATDAGISRITAEARPSDKVKHIRALRSSGRKVAMVGDGVNDAAALAAADVGIAFATGADIAGETAGVNLIGSTPQLVADCVELARGSLRVIRQNLFWAFIYNALMIPAAATGRLAPGIAAAAMMISSLTVVLNALRLRRVIGW